MPGSGRYIHDAATQDTQDFQFFEKHNLHVVDDFYRVGQNGNLEDYVESADALPAGILDEWIASQSLPLFSEGDGIAYQASAGVIDVFPGVSAAPDS